MSVPKALLVILGLAACAPVVPESNPGVGFGDYSDYIRQREAAAAQPQPSQPVFSTDAVGAAIDRSDGSGAPMGGIVPAGSQPYGAPVQYGQPSGGPLVGAVIGEAPLDAHRPRGGAPTNIKQEAGEMAGHSTISDEQNFAAVSSRETIASDKERLAQQRAQYEVIEPTALPQRTGKAEPNIVQFALNTRHMPGTQMYKRSSLFSGGGNCGRYASPDLAQEDFLASGGPEKDKKGLDPDGDGFACGWDPRPFRTALQ